MFPQSFRERGSNAVWRQMPPPGVPACVSMRSLSSKVWPEYPQLPIKLSLQIPPKNEFQIAKHQKIFPCILKRPSHWVILTVGIFTLHFRKEAITEGPVTWTKHTLSVYFFILNIQSLRCNNNEWHLTDCPDRSYVALWDNM